MTCKTIQRGWRARLLALVSGGCFALLAVSPCRAEFGNPESPWSLTAQVGGTAAYGRARQYVHGRRADGEGRDALRYAIDLRATVTRTFGRFFALSGQLGLTNWQSEYRADGGYGRSNFLSLALAPELRIPFGSCQRCPVAYAGPRLAAVASQLGQGAPYAAVNERGWAGFGGGAGGRLGLQLRLHRRLAFGLKLETGFEFAWLRHRVELVGVETLTQRFELARVVNAVGFWWTP